MKDWQFWFLLAITGATMVIVIKIAIGLQQASDTVTKVYSGISTNPLVELIGKIV